MVSGTQNGTKHSIVVDEKTGECSGRPQIFSIEVTSRCNLSCIMCAYHSCYNETRNGGIDITRDLFDACLPFIKNAELVSLCGAGEPLLHPELPEMVKKCTDLGIPTVITTNGTLLDRDRITALLSAGLSFIEISIDGTSSYQKIRGVSFDKLENNLKELARIRNEMNSSTPVIDLSYTAMTDTLPELPEIIQLGALIGAREVRVQPIQIFFAQLLDQNIYLNPENTIKHLSWARREAQKVGIELAVRRLEPLVPDQRYGDDDRFNTLFRKYRCLEPFTSCLVKANSSIQLCCGGITLSKNLGDLDIDKLWNCNEARELRLELIEGKMRKKCLKCNLISGSVENQVLVMRKAVFSDIFSTPGDVLSQYVEHIKGQGFIRGNIDVFRKFGREVIAGSRGKIGHD